MPDLDRSRQQRDFVRALYYMTKAIDPTRPVIANDGWQHAVGDIFGVHDYAPTGDMLRDRYADREAVARTFREVRPHHHPLTTEGRQLADEPIVISEFGGLSIQPGAGQRVVRLRPVRGRRSPARPLRGAGRRAVRIDRARRLLLHPADRHRAGNQRAADRRARAQVRHRAGARDQHPPVALGAQRNHGCVHQAGGRSAARAARARLTRSFGLSARSPAPAGFRCSARRSPASHSAQRMRSISITRRVLISSRWLSRAAGARRPRDRRSSPARPRR